MTHLPDDTLGAIRSIAHAITPLDTLPGRVPGAEDDGVVTSLTEAQMSIASALHRIASALETIAENHVRASLTAEE